MGIETAAAIAAAASAGGAPLRRVDGKPAVRKSRRPKYVFHNERLQGQATLDGAANPPTNSSNSSGGGGGGAEPHSPAQAAGDDPARAGQEAGHEGRPRLAEQRALALTVVCGRAPAP